MNQQIREVVLSAVMQKQAEERSRARRAVLQKIAAFDNVSTEVVGALASPLIGAGIGAAVSGAAGKGAAPGAIAGLAAGTGASYLGSIIAALRRRRTRKEQVEHDSKTHLENLIPGVASYNYAKRLGRVLGGVGETDEQLKV